MSESCTIVTASEHSRTQVAHNADLLAELELLAKDRYSEVDEDYMKVSTIDNNYNYTRSPFLP